MKAFIAVVKNTGAVLDKYKAFDTQAEADAHVVKFGGFVAPSLGNVDNSTEFWIVDDVAKTLVLNQSGLDAATRERHKLVSFEDFQGRFTDLEWNGATDFIYEVDIANGKPKHRALIQGLANVQAKNTVDLLHQKTNAFMNALVSGGILSTARKDVILTP